MNALQAIEKLKTMPPDEPVFILRGQDKTADGIVSQWVYKQAERLGWNHPKVTSAEAVQADMSAWPTRKLPD